MEVRHNWGPRAVMMVRERPEVKGYFLKTYLFYLIYMSVSPSCMYMHHMHAQCPQRSEEGGGFRRTRVMGYKLPCVMWVLRVKPEFPVIATSALTTEPLQPLTAFFFFFCRGCVCVCVCVCVLRQGFSVQPRLSWNSLCRPGWSGTQKSACLCATTAWVTAIFFLGSE